MEKNKLVDSLKNGQLDLDKYLENLQIVLDKDTQALGLLHQALMTAAKAKQRDKSQRIMKEIKQISDRFKIIKIEVSVLQRENNIKNVIELGGKLN